MFLQTLFQILCRFEPQRPVLVTYLVSISQGNIILQFYSQNSFYRDMFPCCEEMQLVVDSVPELLWLQKYCLWARLLFWLVNNPCPDMLFEHAFKRLFEDNKHPLLLHRFKKICKENNL
jgi:hypothetical protein